MRGSTWKYAWFPDMGPRCRGQSNSLFEISFDTCLSQTRASHTCSYNSYKEHGALCDDEPDRCLIRPSLFSSLQCTNTAVILKLGNIRGSIGIFTHEVSFQKFNGHSSKLKQMNKRDKARTAGKSYLCTTCFRIYATCNKFEGVPNILSVGFDTKALSI